LHEFAKEPADVSLPMLSDAMRARLIKYVEGSKAGDFAVRAMLADDVKLDLVAKLRKQGKSEVREYHARYPAREPWAFAAGIVDARTAMLVYDREISLETSAYFVAWISMAIAWSRSMTSCLPVMRWTASTCPYSIPHRSQ
jgi:RNA polymerase sigma-70 factor (ECF subfamily)